MNNTFYIDNITWNDLSLDEIYSRLNSCRTSAGEDYLYKRIRNPFIKDCEEFDEQIKLLDEIKASENNFPQIEKALASIGKLKGYKFSEELEGFKDAKNESNIRHYIIDLIVIFAFILIFILPGPGMVLFFGSIAYSVSDYFKTKNIISGKLTVFNYLIKVIKSVKYFSYRDDDKSDVLNKKINRLYEIRTEFKPFMMGTFIISEGARTTSNPLSIVFDYIRMIFHVDIIKYNSMINFVKEHLEEANEAYTILGIFDSMICLANVKDAELNITKLNTAELCKPILREDATEIKLCNAIHPLVKDAVPNSINTSKNVLITGCNASGKSTFLKLVALNALFAQSFGFCFADEYEAPYVKIYSSMALNDSIDAGESYYMAEIKSLKRIIDESNETDSKVLCVIDEVLRGTNTVERIAASVEILKSLSKENIFCFAATHDIELTELLSDYYENYHFSEEVLEDDVKFSYTITEGPANSRNAIRLLSVLGYDNELIENASKRADRFINEGVWV